MKAEDKSKSVEVFAGSAWQAELIKGVLEDNHIRCLIKDGCIGSLSPYMAPEVSVQVTEEDYEAATRIIEERGEPGEKEV